MGSNSAKFFCKNFNSLRIQFLEEIIFSNTSILKPFGFLGVTKPLDLENASCLLRRALQKWNENGD
jgi:hypothetical protein